MTAQAVVFTPDARQSQEDFREVLECLARPGRLGRVGESPFPLTGARHAYALLRALADQEVSISIDGAEESVARFASLGTGSRLVESEVADYVLFLTDPGDQLAHLCRGELEVPEFGATAVVLVESLASGDRYVVSGPGVPGAREFRMSGISPATLVARDAACAFYPLGIDIVFVDPGGRMVGLPRTTVIERQAD